jgi:hypothetical protein
MSDLQNLNIPTNDPANLNDFVFEGRKGAPRRRKSFAHKMVMVQTYVQEDLLKVIDVFCTDNGVTRASFFRMSLYRYAKEMGISEYVRKADEDQPSERGMEKELKPDTEQRNAYGSPWTTDDGDTQPPN